MEALEALDARSGEVRAPVRLRTESDVCAATEAASPRAPRNPRPALSLLAAPPTRPPQLQSRAEVDYKVWVERVVAEAVLPGGLGRASAAVALLYAAFLEPRDLSRLATTCRALRGRASAGGAASLVEVAASIACREAYRRLRPRLPSSGTVPDGPALLRARRGRDERHARPSWAARLESLRRGTLLVGDAAPAPAPSDPTLPARARHDVAVREVVDGRCVELSRRDGAPGPAAKLAAPNRGSLLLLARSHDPWFDAPLGDGGAADDAGGAGDGPGHAAVRWDPSTATWTGVDLWRGAPAAGGGAGDAPPASPALRDTNFRRAAAVDGDGRLYVASCKYRVAPRPDAAALAAFRRGDVVADRQVWHVARRRSAPAGAEEDAADAAAADTDLWTRLPGLVPWRPTLDLLLVPVRARRRAAFDGAPAFDGARQPPISLGDPGPAAGTLVDRAAASLASGVAPDVAARDVGPGPSTPAPARERLGDALHGPGWGPQDLPPGARADAQAWLGRRLLRRDAARAARKRRGVANAAAAPAEAETTLLAVCLDSNARSCVAGGASVYALEPGRRAWVLVAVAPRLATAAFGDAVACGPCLVLVGRAPHDAIALDLDDLVWRRVAAPPGAAAGKSEGHIVRAVAAPDGSARVLVISQMQDGVSLLSDTPLVPGATGVAFGRARRHNLPFATLPARQKASATWITASLPLPL